MTEMRAVDSGDMVGSGSVEVRISMSSLDGLGGRLKGRGREGVVKLRSGWRLYWPGVVVKCVGGVLGAGCKASKSDCSRPRGSVGG